MDTTKFPDIARQAIAEARDSLINTFDPEYIIMGGSFAKGDWLFDNKGSLLSDFEIVFINRKKWSRKKAKTIAKSLYNKYQLDFNLSGYSKRRILNKHPGNLSIKSPGYITLTFFDTINEKNIIYKKKQTNVFLPEISLEEVPIWEGWKLFVNRIGDLLKAKYLNNSQNINYYWLNLFQAAADTLLIIAKKYKSDIKNRYNNIHKIGRYIDINTYNFPNNDYIKLLTWALKSRKEHNLSLFMNVMKDIEISKRIPIIEFYFSRLERFMFDDENISIVDYKEYLNDFILQNKYSRFYLSKNFSVIYSNILSMIYNFKRLNKKIRYFSFSKSIRHIIFVTIVVMFDELKNKHTDLSTTRLYLKMIYKKKYIDSLSRNEIIQNVISSWEIFR